MRFLSRLFLRGLVAILPLGLTGGLIWWAFAGTERLLHELLIFVLPDVPYHPGMGFALAVPLVMVVGLLMYSWVIRRLYGAATSLLERIPVVKSIYGMIVDVVRVFGSSDERPFQKVVLVRIEDSFEQLGFLTRESCDDLAGVGAGKVAVYLPMSYQLGGFTVIVAKERLREVDMPVEEALRFSVTAGVTSKAH